MNSITERAILAIFMMVVIQTLMLFGIFMFLSFEADWFAWLWTTVSVLVLYKMFMTKIIDEVERNNR